VTVPRLDEPTRSAHWGWTEHRYFGHRVFGELTGRESLAGLLALSIVGRRLSPDCSALLDDAAAALTLADPRIWPLKLTRVVATYGHMLPALCAGMLMEDEARIGPWAFLEAAKALLELHATLGTGSVAPERVREVVDTYLGKHGFIWGFGTPFRSEDERLVAFRRCVGQRQRDQLPYWKTMELVSQAVRAARKAEPNIGVALAAVLLDMGLTPTQIGALVVSLMQHMFFAHAVEGVGAKTALRELPEACVTYEGRPARQSPRAEAEAAAGVRTIAGAPPAAE
jgi:hypothetical protein